jgi:hypothetical protein
VLLRKKLDLDFLVATIRTAIVATIEHGLESIFLLGKPSVKVITVEPSADAWSVEESLTL